MFNIETHIYSASATILCAGNESATRAFNWEVSYRKRMQFGLYTAYISLSRCCFSSKLLQFFRSSSKQTNNTDSRQVLYVVVSLPGCYNLSALPANRQTIPIVNNFYMFVIFLSSSSKQTNNTDSRQLLSSGLLQFLSSSSKQTNAANGRQFLDVVSLQGCYNVTALATYRQILPIADTFYLPGCHNFTAIPANRRTLPITNMLKMFFFSSRYCTRIVYCLRPGPCHMLN